MMRRHEPLVMGALISLEVVRAAVVRISPSSGRPARKLSVTTAASNVRCRIVICPLDRGRGCIRVGVHASQALRTAKPMVFER